MGLDLQYQFQRMKAENKAKTQQIQELKEQLELEEVHALKADLAAKDDALKAVQDILDSKRQAIARLENDRMELEAENADLREKLGSWPELLEKLARWKTRAQAVADLEAERDAANKAMAQANEAEEKARKRVAKIEADASMHTVWFPPHATTTTCFSCGTARNKIS